jgi:ABC-type multidrug transport system fused ATPase/permease subunit
MNKAKTIDVSDFDRPEFSEKLENANREAGMRPIQILHATFNILSAVISAVSFVVILAALHPLAPVVMIVMAIPSTIVNYRFRHKNFRYIRHHSKERRQMNYFSSLVSDKDKVKEIRIMGLADTLIGKYKEAFVKYFAGLKRLIIKEHLAHTILNIVSLVAHCMIFMYVAYTVIYRDGLIGDYTLYTGALGSIVGYVSTVVSSSATIYEGTLFIDNVITFMNEDILIVPSVSPAIKPKKGDRHEIEFKNVTFRYPGTGSLFRRRLKSQ